jgi:hypothetical protein
MSKLGEVSQVIPVRTFPCRRKCPRGLHVSCPRNPGISKVLVGGWKTNWNRMVMKTLHPGVGVKRVESD